VSTLKRLKRLSEGRRRQCSSTARAKDSLGAADTHHVRIRLRRAYNINHSLIHPPAVHFPLRRTSHKRLLDHPMAKMAVTGHLDLHNSSLHHIPREAVGSTVPVTLSCRTVILRQCKYARGREQSCYSSCFCVLRSSFVVLQYHFALSARSFRYYLLHFPYFALNQRNKSLSAIICTLESINSVFHHPSNHLTLDSFSLLRFLHSNLSLKELFIPFYQYGCLC